MAELFAQLDVSGRELILLLLALLLSALFSGAETALTALSEARARALISEGGIRNKLLQLWLDRPTHLLTATLIGTHSANTVVAVVTALVADRLFHSLAVTVLVAVFVIAVLVFGDLTPRSFAKSHAYVAAPLLMPLVWLTYMVSFPLVLLFTRFSHVLTRVAGGAVTRTGPFVTEDDIVSMIQLGSKEGVLDKAEGRMLASIFDLGDTLVKEVMVPRTEISALPVDANLEQVLKEARSRGHSRMPIYDETLDEVKGFFHAKDLLNVLADKKPFLLREHLRPVLFVPELMHVSDLLKLFQRKKIHLAVVVDEYGGTAGIVAFEDVLEEIVGPIQDEHDDDDLPVKKLEDGRLVAEGRAGLYEISEALGVMFPPEGGYETLGGFLIARTGRMPVPGDRIVFSGWSFLVKEGDEKRVAKVEIERSAPGTPSTLPQAASMPPAPADAAIDPPADGAPVAVDRYPAESADDQDVEEPSEPSGPIKLVRSA